VCIAGAITLACGSRARCQNPGTEWEQYRLVEQAGFSRQELCRAKAYYDSLASSALMVVIKGKVVAAWGEINRRFTVHSIRKSLLNSLIGIYVANGTIDTNLTLGQLGITERDSLSERELSARIVHLLKSRSGVYHRAAAEPAWVEAARPARDSNAPDSVWFYNNWDFNVLGRIAEKFTGRSIYETFCRDVAVSLGMEDYRVLDGEYFYEREYSVYPAYHLKMSARDLARYGQLFLQRGIWSGRRILPASWVDASTYPHSKHGGGTKIGRWYGYLWGVSEYYSSYGMYFASGIGGQFLAVFPSEEMVIVHLCDTYRSRHVFDRELVHLFDLILAAKTGEPLPDPEGITLQPASRIPTELSSEPVESAKYVGTWEIDGRSVTILERDGDLLLKDCWQKFRLLPLSSGGFFVEDLETHLNVDRDEAGVPQKLFYDVREEPPCR
jgi:CubicO group peptidase (beta-lactamase class C family)